MLIVRKQTVLVETNPAELGKDDLDKIVDIAGWHDDLDRSDYTNAVSSTDLWPLREFEAPEFTDNKLEVNKVHYRQHKTTKDGRSGVGSTVNSTSDSTAAFRDIGFTGVGYKRRITGGAVYGGTPGYDNSALKSDGSVITRPVYISEIMYVDGPNGTLHSGLNSVTRLRLLVQT